MRENTDQNNSEYGHFSRSELLELKNIERICSNLTCKERKALSELKPFKNTLVRIQDKGSRFVLLTNKDFEEEIEHQITIGSFDDFPSESSKELGKWESNETSTNYWVKFNKLEQLKPDESTK